MRANHVLMSSFLLVAALWHAAVAAPAELANETMVVELYGDRPAVKGYLHLATGEKFAGADDNGTLVINGQSVPWSEFEIKVAGKKESVQYHLDLADRGVSFDMEFLLEDDGLAFSLKNVQDPHEKLKTIGWQDRNRLRGGECVLMF